MTSNTLGIGGVHRCGTWASIGNGIVDFHQCGAWPASASVRHRRRPSMRHVGQHRYRHRRLPSMRRVANIGIGAASPTTGLDVFADNRSGCVRRRQVWMYSPTTGLDVFAGDRSGCIRRQQVTPRRLRRAPGAGGVRARIRANAGSRSPAPAIRSRGRATLRRRSHSSA